MFYTLNILKFAIYTSINLCGSAVVINLGTILMKFVLQSPHGTRLKQVTSFDHVTLVSQPLAAEDSSLEKGESVTYQCPTPIALEIASVVSKYHLGERSQVSISCPRHFQSLIGDPSGLSVQEILGLMMK